METNNEFPVRVVANKETKAILNVSAKNPEYGNIILKQQKISVDDGGFAVLKTVSTLLQGTIETLQGLSKNWYEGKAIEGKIQVLESMEPFNTKDPANDIKKAGDTGIVLTVGGAPIYRKTVWDPTGSKVDTHVQHDNKAELRAAYEAQKAAAMSEESDFQIG